MSSSTHITNLLLDARIWTIKFQVSMLRKRSGLVLSHKRHQHRTLQSLRFLSSGYLTWVTGGSMEVRLGNILLTWTYQRSYKFKSDNGLCV